MCQQRQSESRMLVTYSCSSNQNDKWWILPGEVHLPSFSSSTSSLGSSKEVATQYWLSESIWLLLFLSPILPLIIFWSYFYSAATSIKVIKSTSESAAVEVLSSVIVMLMMILSLLLLSRDSSLNLRREGKDINANWCRDFSIKERGQKDSPIITQGIKCRRHLMLLPPLPCKQEKEEEDCDAQE